MEGRRFIKNYIIGFFEFLPILAIYGFAKLLPIDWSSALFAKLAGKIGPLLKVSRRGHGNLKLAFPEKSDAELDKLVKQTWENLGRIAGEFPHVQAIANDPQRVEVIGIENLHAARASKTPYLMLAGHLGNWELPHYITLREGLSIGLISRPPNNPWTKKFFEWVRYHPKVPIFYKSVEGSRQMIKYIAGGGHMGILFDQRLSDGMPLPLFDHPALTSLGPAKMAKKFKGNIIPVQVARLDNKSKFQVTFHPPLDMNLSSEDLMTQMNKHLENWIRQNPTQWLWFHKRWKM